MPRFLICIHRFDDYDPAIAEDDAMRRDIDALNEQMLQAGVRVFVGGLHHAGSAKSLRPDADGGVIVSDSAYLATDEHVGGLWVLELANLDEALVWARKAVSACRASVECGSSIDDRQF